MEILVVVDMQNDFVDGALGTPEAQAIVFDVAQKIRDFEGDVVCYTIDTHDENYLNTQEGKNLPVKHCIKGTHGWKLNPVVLETMRNLREDQRLCRFEKSAFGSIALGEWLTKFNTVGNGIAKVHFVGLCTGICVISNVLIAKAALPEAEIIVDASCCACVIPESHQIALNAMKLCQVTIENWEELK